MNHNYSDNTRILVVDASREDRNKLKFLLNMGGYFDVVFAETTSDAYNLLGIGFSKNAADDYDLVLIDIFMDKKDGIRSLEKIKSVGYLKDIPFIIVTENNSLEDMLSAFEIGVTDYIIKPIDNKIELIARVNSAIKLKKEMDIRKAREKELLNITNLLEESNKKLQQANLRLEEIASTDGLTGLANRRYFQEYSTREWKRAMRSLLPLSIFLMDIDHFKLYNDYYGHLQGDNCLKMFAGSLKNTFKRPGDLPARYGGEEFIVILPETNINGALSIAQKLQQNVADLNIPHEKSKIINRLTFSMGIITFFPSKDMNIEKMIACADKALYQAKDEGRNRFVISSYSALQVPPICLNKFPVPCQNHGEDSKR